MTAALAILLASVGSGLPVPPVPAADLRVPAGFAVYTFAGQALANDIYTLTIDDAGRVIVAGRGYVRVLVDDNNDGIADRAIDLIDGLNDGPMGLCADGGFLYVVADGGLKRYPGYNGKDKLKDPETLLAVKTAGEHEAHAIRRGPDGMMYLLCGNTAGITKQTITTFRSPVRDPIAGCLVRFSRWNASEVEVVADGFRNPYSFDFNVAGEPFTYDADNERCVGLPWYEPCRFYHVVPGGNYGWRTPQIGQFWRKPPYFADVVAPVCTLGRGSPTGVACYRHTHFPAEYRGGFFLADWTFGRVYHVPLEAKGSTWTGQPKVFLEATGESGFAPTGLAVHPKSGELFVSIGGRGTRGGVYRVTCREGFAGKPIPMEPRSLDYGNDAGTAIFDAVAGADPAAVRRGLEMLVRFRDKGFHPNKVADAVKAHLSSSEPLIRAAAGRVFAAYGIPVGGPQNTAFTAQAKLTLAVETAKDEPEWALDVALAVLDNPRADPALQLQAARVAQLALGDLTSKDAAGTVWEGYTFRKPVNAGTVDRVRRVLHPLMDRYPRSNIERPTTPELDREIARVAAGIGGGATEIQQYQFAEWVGRYKLDRANLKGKIDALTDTHYLICLGRLPPYATRDVDGTIAQFMLGLDRKLKAEGLNRDRHWPLRMDELGAALITGHLHLSDSMARQPDFARPENFVFVRHAKLRSGTLAGMYVGAAENDPDFAWTPRMVKLLTTFIPRERAMLQKLWDRGGLEDTIITVLAAHPNPEDAPKFLTGLNSLDPEVVRVSANALPTVERAVAGPVFVAGIRALRRLPDDKPAKPARDAVGMLLERHAKVNHGTDVKKWAEWLAAEYPALAKQLDSADGFDPAAWKKRQAGIDWAAGDAAKGKAVFTKANCAACHDGGRALGPPLQGVGKRFGRDDLLTAILQPSKDVPPRYRPTRFTTTDGKAFIGMVVYEATDGVILQTGVDTTVRIAGDQIESKRPVETSLMPAWLLDKLTDKEIADLMAYLKSL